MVIRKASLRLRRSAGASVFWLKGLGLRRTRSAVMKTALTRWGEPLRKFSVRLKLAVLNSPTAMHRASVSSGRVSCF